MKTIYFFLLTSTLFIACKKPEAKDIELSIAEEIQEVLQSKMIDVWYPRAIDSVNGGYFSDFNYKWEPDGAQDKFIVTQARHVWALSFLFDRYKENLDYLKWADHGFQFLRDHMWDQEAGGFFQLTNVRGEIEKSPAAFEKTAYGNSFAIYGLAEYYKVSKNEEALDLARKTFYWLDDYARDSVYGGYFQMLDREGTPIPRAKANDYSHSDRAQIGLKDYNSSIHLLEAFTTLYEVWPDSLLRERLEEMYMVVSEKMMDERGFLKLFFHPDWTMVTDEELKQTGGGNSYISDHITFGHDVETAFLLYEAAQVLGKDESIYFQKIKSLVDHPIQMGWDEKYGGLFDQGKYVDGKMTILSTHKEWWSQAEALNSFLLMHYLFPDDPQNYDQKFKAQWNYISTYLIDHKHGGWYLNGLDVSKDFAKRNKASIWKGNYHTTRALVHCLLLLEELEAKKKLDEQD